MAKQLGPILFKGSLGGITFYESRGMHLAKQQNHPPSKSRYKNHIRYSNVRRNAGWFSEAQKLASEVYGTLPRAEKDQRLVWYPLRNKAQELVRKEMNTLEILALLKLELTNLTEKRKAKTTRNPLPLPRYDPVLPLLPFTKQREIESKATPREEILLGRYYARTDNLCLISELHGFNTILRELLHSHQNEGSLLAEKRKALKPTRKLRW